MTGNVISSVRYSDFKPNAYAHGTLQTAKNTTKRQDRQINKTLQGVLVNAYIKDKEQPQASSLDDISSSLIIPDEFKESSAAKDIVKLNEPKKRSLISGAFPYVAGAVMAAGMGLAISSSFAKSQKFLKPGNVPQGVKLPAVGKNINLHSEEYFAIYMAIQEPKARNLVALGAVFVMSALTYGGKTLVDGVKKVWLKHKEADVKKEFEESSIDFETQAFAGKLDVVRSELVEKTKYFKEKIALAPSKQDLEQEEQNIPLTIKKPALKSKLSLGLSSCFNFNGINFGNSLQNSPKQEENLENKPKTFKDKALNFYDKIKNSQLALAALTVVTLGIIALSGKGIFNNIQKAAQQKEKALKQSKEAVRQSLTDATQEFRTAAGANRDKILNSIKEKLFSIGADEDEALSVLRSAGVEEGVAQKIAAEIDKSVKKMKFGDSFYVQADPAMGGKEGTQFYIYIDQAKGYIYDVITHPENKFARYLFTAITAAGSTGYVLKETLDAIKEAAVVKENTQTELDLQYRLVDTDIRNFKAKKQSAIEPMVIEFDRRFNEGATQEELKTLAENILVEIKNGPPFVYA